MKKLISTVAAVVLGITTFAGAAPGQGAMGKAAEKAHDKAVKDEKARSKGRKVYSRDQRQVIRRDIKADRRDLKADEKELKRLRKDLKQAQKARDWRRAQRDRAAISRLEYEIRAERQYIKNNDGRNAPVASRRDTRSWWARHLGRNGT
jgi:hypothetical protein